MNAILHAIGYWLLDFGLLASAVMLAALALRLLVRQPATRVAIGWGTWLGIAALAVVTALPAWPRLELTELWRQPTAEVELPPADLLALEPVVVYASPEAALPRPIAAPETEPEPIVPWPSLSPPQWLAAAWLMAAAATLAWIGLGLLQTRRLLRRATPAPAWVQAELHQIVGTLRVPLPADGTRSVPTTLPRVLASRRIASAVALGALKPKIVLPAESIREDNAAAIRAALAHEWAHIRHGDLWLLLIERLLAPLLATHPLFWWLRRGVRLDQEIVADNAAAGDDPIEYADALLAWAQQSQSTPAGLAALSLWESPHTLSRRIAMLVSPHRSAAQSRGWQVAILAGLLAFVGGLSLLTLRPATADDEKPAAETPPSVHEPAAERAPGPPPPLRRAPRQIMMKVYIIEAPEAALTRQLPKDQNDTDEDPPAAEQQTPRATYRILPSEAAWNELLDNLQADPAANVISRPQVVTLDGQVAHVQIGSQMPIVVPSADGKAPRRKLVDVGTTVRLRPRLVFPNPGAEPQGVTLEMEVHHTSYDVIDPEKDLRGLRSLMMPSTVHVPLARFAVIAFPHPSSGGAKDKMMVLAVQPALAPVGFEFGFPGGFLPPPAAQGSPEETLQAPLRALEAYLKSAAAADDPIGSRAKLQNLRREIEKMLREQEVMQQRVKTEGFGPDRFQKTFRLRHVSVDAAIELLRKKHIEGNHDIPISGIDVARNTITYYGTADENEMVSKWIDQIDRPAAAKAENPEADAAQRPRPQFFRVQHQDPHDVAKALRARLADAKVSGVTIGVDSVSSSLVMVIPPEHRETVRKWIAEIDQPPRAESAGTAAPRRALQENWLGGSVNSESGLTGQLALDERNFNLAPLVDRQTQIKLIEVELQVAQLNLKAAENDFERVQQLHERKLVSSQELEAKKLAVDRAHLQLQKLQVLLEGLRKQPPPPVPAPSEPQPAAPPPRR